MDLKFPDQKELEESVIRALKANQGQATSKAIDEFVINDLKLTQEQRSRIRQGSRTEIQYRLAWVRTKAKSKGIIERTGSATWKLL